MPQQQDTDITQNKENKTVLRKCRYCGLEASTENELEMFKKHKDSKYGREETCKYCHNEYKDTPYPTNRKRKQRTSWLRKCTQCGKEANVIEELSIFCTDKHMNYGRKNLCIDCNNTLYVYPWKKKHPIRKSNHYECKLFNA